MAVTNSCFKNIAMSRQKEDRIKFVQQDILRKLGMVTPPTVNANITAPSLNGEAAQKLIEAVVRAPPPTKSSLFINGLLVENGNGNPNSINEQTTTSNSPMGVGVTDVNEFATSEIYAQRLQSFYPSCGIPNFTIPSVWKHPNQREMRLFFDLNIPKSSDSTRPTHVTIMWAKLRLYVSAGPGCRNNELNANSGMNHSNCT